MSINTLKTAALLGFLTAILLIGGQAIAGRQGLYMALAITAIMNFVSYFFSEKIPVPVPVGRTPWSARVPPDPLLPL